MLGPVGDITVPGRENSGILMSSVCIVLLVLAGRGGKGDGCWAGGIVKWGS
jgi:hypothetical protein